MIFCCSDQERIRLKMKKDKVDYFFVEENDRCVSPGTYNGMSLLFFIMFFNFRNCSHNYGLIRRRHFKQFEKLMTDFNV